MDRVVKLNSVEAGNFTASQNRVSFELPSGGVYDLSKSYINLNTRINITEAPTVEGGTGVYPMDLQWVDTTANKPKFNNCAVVKNCLMKSSQKGIISNVRRVDNYKALVDSYTKSRTETLSESYDASNQILDNEGSNQFSVYRDYEKLGNVKSTQNDIAPIKVMLKDLFDFASVATEYDTTKAGTTTIELELNLDKLQPVQRMKSITWGTGVNLMEDVAVTGDGNTIITKAKIYDLKQSPYYVGQKLTVASITGPLSKDAVISSITRQADSTLVITFEQNWGAASTAYADVSVSTKDIGSAELEVNFAEIVVTQKAMASSDVDEIEHYLVSTEELVLPSVSSYQRQFEIEPASCCVLIGFPSATNDLNSSNANISSYRLRLDNEDLSNRDVVVRSPLYYDVINNTLTNMKRRLKNTTEETGRTNTDSQADKFVDVFTNSFQTISLMSPVEQKPDRPNKYLQVNIAATATLQGQKMNLYKIIPTVFSY